MWISQITLRNFRPFYADDESAVVFKFDKASKSKFTVIEAKSDVGKTTLLSAVAWCLYGRESPGIGGKTDYEGKSVGPFSRTKLYELRDGQVSSVEVAIVLNDSRTDRPLYNIERSQLFERAGGNAQPRGESRLTIHRWDGGDNARIVPTDYAQMVINSILPEDIHLFFLFEGEKLEKHFSFNDTENISSAVEKTSQIKQVLTAVAHLETVHDDVWATSTSRVDSEVAKMRQEIDDLQKRIERETADLLKNRQALEKSSDDLRALEEYLEKNNAVAVRERAIRQRQLEEENQGLAETVRDLKRKYREEVITNVPLAMLTGPLSKLHERLEEEKSKDELEPNIDSKYLDEILKQKKCVCGRTLNPKNHDDGSCIELIKKKLSQNRLSDLKELFRDGRYEVEGISNALNVGFRSGLGNVLTRIDDLEGRVVANHLEIDRISSEQKGLDDREVVRVQSERDALRVARDEQNRAIGRQEIVIRTKEAELAQKRRELDAQARKLEGTELKRRQADFLDRAIKHLTSISSEIVGEVRLKVQDRTWEYFRTLHWEKAKYKSFEIDENYGLHLLDSNKTNWINDLASGPKQLLLLSFIAALSEVSGFKFPVFFDTPLANIDNEQRDNVAKMLPDYLKDTQVILLMKDQEYTPRIRELLNKRVCAELRMTHSQGKTVVT
jgi:DNA sulfur modification protein DndD